MTKNNKGVLRIGTSGIVVPGSRQTFPAAFQSASRLHYYSSLFNTLEVNSTFKKLPRPSTLEKWSLDVGDAFQFTIKLSKEVTHAKQMDFDLGTIASFLSTINHIGDKKGCILVQFPGSITSQYSGKVEEALLTLQKLDHNKKWRIATEFRHESWYTKSTQQLVDKYNASMVLHDMPKSKNLEFDGQVKFIYYRFHGPKGDYRGSYDVEFLEQRAKNIRGYLDDNKDVYAYFNNTMGDAFNNAMSLKAMVEGYSPCVNSFCRTI